MEGRGQLADSTHCLPPCGSWGQGQAAAWWPVHVLAEPCASPFSFLFDLVWDLSPWVRASSSREFSFCVCSPSILISSCSCLASIHAHTPGSHLDICIANAFSGLLWSISKLRTSGLMSFLAPVWHQVYFCHICAFLKIAQCLRHIKPLVFYDENFHFISIFSVVFLFLVVKIICFCFSLIFQTWSQSVR